MKATPFIVLFFLLSGGILAQEKLMDILPLKDGKVTYTNIVNVENVTKEELYIRAKRWIAFTCNAIMFDKENEIIAKGYLKTINGYIWHTIRIQIKDGKYKYEIKNFKVKYYSMTSGSSNDIDESPEDFKVVFYKETFYKGIDTGINALIESLDKTMRASDDNNW